MNEQEKEIRRILLNRTRLGADGCITATQAGAHDLLQGLGTGWGSIHILGLACRQRQYRMKGGAAADFLPEVLNRLGRKVRLETAPQADACLCRGLLSMPVLVTAEREKRMIRVSAYTARDATAELRCRRVLNALEKGLPETVEAVEMPKPTAEEHRQTWAERRREKAEKRADKKAARKAKKEKQRLADALADLDIGSGDDKK